MNTILRNFTVNSGKYVIIIASVQTIYTAHTQLEKEKVQLRSVSLERTHSLKAEFTAPIRCTYMHFNKCEVIRDQRLLRPWSPPCRSGKARPGSGWTGTSVRRQSTGAKSVNTESLRRSRVAPRRGVSPRLGPTAAREPGCLQTGAVPPRGASGCHAACAAVCTGAAVGADTAVHTSAVIGADTASTPVLPSVPMPPPAPALLSVPMLPRTPRFAACAVGLRPCGRSVRSCPVPPAARGAAERAVCGRRSQTVPS